MITFLPLPTAALAAGVSANRRAGALMTLVRSERLPIAGPLSFTAADAVAPSELDLQIWSIVRAWEERETRPCCRDCL